MAAPAAATARAQALSLLAAANNHGDLAVKLSSLRQVKEILLSLEPSLSAEIFPYLAELHLSREILVRKSLIEIIEEVGLRMLDHSYVLVSVLLVLSRDEDPTVAKKSISVGTTFFCTILEEMAMQVHTFSQFHHRGKVDRWCGELWTWMVKFKDTVFATALEPGCVGVKVLALKFMETFILLFTPDASDPEKASSEGSRHMFNISWLAGGHPILNPATLMSEANRTFGILVDFIQSANRLPGALTISVISWYVSESIPLCLCRYFSLYSS
ncbi:T22C5.2 [Arabidopsis thaliana]|uniref:T22C5.2 n=1 Tax=Arabidopsis thaliana TaxID=3702 RepID=Q9SFZ9_ARATH|nr:T22C5.2 [Arabidopsis thaliana]